MEVLGAKTPLNSFCGRFDHMYAAVDALSVRLLCVCVGDMCSCVFVCVCVHSLMLFLLLRKK